jgi:hypothetical protein
MDDIINGLFPSKGERLGSFILEEKINETSRSQIWKMKPKTQKSGKILRTVAKLTSIDLYPGSKEVCEKLIVKKNLQNLEEYVKTIDIDFVNSKKLNPNRETKRFSNVLSFYGIGYISNYDMIYHIVQEMTGDILTYPKDPLHFLENIYTTVRKLHSETFYTSNNLSVQDVMYLSDKNEDTIYLVDLKNLTAFGESLSFVNLEDQENIYLSYNIVSSMYSGKDIKPRFYDDIESIIYLYAIVCKFTYPNLNNHNLIEQITVKKKLDFLPEVLRDAIFELRELSENSEEYTFDNPENLERFSKEYLVVDDIIRKIFAAGNLVGKIEYEIPVINMEYQDREQSISEKAFTHKIREEVIVWNKINPDAIDNFVHAIVEYVYRGQIFEMSVQRMITEFLELSILQYRH